MTIAYFSNFLNHHQKLLADELVKLTSGNFIFVETEPMYEWLKKGGYTDYSDLDYVLCAWKSKESKQKAIELAKTVDVALFGGYTVLYLEVIRAKNCNKISFDVSERWLKRGWLNVLSPRLLKSQWYYHTLFKSSNFYKLCSSAFGATDQYKMHSYENKCYKWGYFTKVDENFEVEAQKQGASTSEITPLMWCSRFLKWKHPELPVQLAARLKAKGYRFVIDMFGSGEELVNTMNLICELGVEDCVNLCGNRPNEEILKEMHKHKIFLFTSDRNEGWGAVLNEAMSNGCVPVVSDSVGSAPFLVENGRNGFLFDSPKTQSGFTFKHVSIDEKSVFSLCEKVEWLLDNPIERDKLAKNAYYSMRDVWSPRNAASNLLRLIRDLESGHDTSVDYGPCSKALPI